MRGGFILVFLSLFLGFQSLAQDRLTYEGFVEDQFGVPLNGFQSLTFKIRSSGSESCVFYTETKSLNVDNGFFKAVLNDGSGSVNFGSNLTQFSEIFIPATRVFNSVDCVTGTTTPANTGRTLEVIIGAESLGVIELTSAPYALQSRMIGASTEQSLLRTTPGQTAPVLSAANLSVLTSLFNGTLTVNEAVTCQNVSGVIPIANGGTGANSEAVARTNLGLGPLATLSLPGDSAQILRGDGTWGVPSGGGGGVASVAGTSQEIVVNNADPTNPVVGLANLATSPAGTYGSSTQAVNLTIDSKGRVTSASNVALDLSPTGKPLISHQMWIGDGSGFSVSRFVGLADLRTPGGAPQFPGSCGAGQSLNYSSVTDALLCSPISIDLSSANATGTLSIGKGGTGAIDATAARANLGAMQAVTAGPAGNLLASNGSSWVSRSPAEASVHSSTQGALTYYVDSSTGNDTNSGVLVSSPLQSIEAALDRIPRHIRHMVTIELAAGNYGPATNAVVGIPRAWITIDKEIHYQSGGFLHIKGTGNPTLFPNFKTDWETGIRVAATSRGVAFSNLQLNGFKQSLAVEGLVILGYQAPVSVRPINASNGVSVVVEKTGQLILSQVSLTDVQKAGILINGGVARTDSNVGVATASLTMQFQSSSPAGSSLILVDEGGVFETDSATYISFDSNSMTRNGISARNGSKVDLKNGPLFLSGTGWDALFSVNQSNFATDSISQPSSTIPRHFRCTDRSRCEVRGSHNFAGGSQFGVFAEVLQGSQFYQQAPFTGTVPLQDGLYRVRGSSSLFIEQQNQTLNANFVSGNRNLIEVSDSSQVHFNQKSPGSIQFNLNVSGGSFQRILRLSRGATGTSSSNFRFDCSGASSSTCVTIEDDSRLVIHGSGTGAEILSGSPGLAALEVLGRSQFSMREMPSGNLIVSSNGANSPIVARHQSAVLLNNENTGGPQVSGSSGAADIVRLGTMSLFQGKVTVGRTCASAESSLCQVTPP